MANTLKLGAGKWATGTDTVLAFNDENNNFKPLPFSFSRASSATVVNQSGLIETVGSGEPRIDFLDNNKGALLLEPQRLNYVAQSETFTGYWGLQGASLIADNNVKNPTGNTFSNILNSTSTGTFKSINKSESSAWDSKTLTMSCFAKKKTNDFIYFHNIGSVSGSPSVYFNISSGTLGSVGSAWSNAKIENYGNGWYRCSATITFGTNTNYLYIANSDGNNNNSSTIGSQTYLWGTQVEEGSYPTSYIPTSGSAVTRVLDTCYNDKLANVIGQTEGTFYLETVPLNSLTSYTERVIQFESSGSGFMTIQRYSNDNITFYGTNGSNNWSIQGTGLFVGGQTIKIAGAYKDNDITLYVNGVQIGTNTTANAPQTEKLRFANNPSGSLGYLGSHKDVKLYNTRLSNSELAALTS